MRLARAKATLMRTCFGVAWTALALALGGCATVEPIEDVTDAPVVAAKGKTVAPGDVGTAIQRAGQSLGWQLLAEAPGLFTGRRQLRHHLAVVEIEFDERAYSIRYRDSTNLEAKDGQIHPAYNQWIESLDKAIRAELGML